ncbi:fatty acid desaturase family protein [Amycolatopsis saalfeldensis]|uniref:Fatty acid desaturase n=1 Tax=Amycolatopsis saalfeldensis TaxID=394193 RepID=A0A1H8YJM0_9PSEU|nr:acyl-CoA desaturase [Amycolatopsis saalfeldensis]SEP52355.1 Fatty acid desaturase [Amycolatopsis saalfeldensis]
MSVPTEPAAVEVRRQGDQYYRELAREVRLAGLLRRRYGYYAVKIGLTLLAFAGGCAAFAVIGDSWWQLAVAAFFAVMSAQLAFLGHDAGHRQVFRRRVANDRLGRVLAGLVGISYGWWMGKHTLHHAQPNHEGADPDLDIPLLAFTSGQSRDRRGLVHWTAKHQAALFFPLLLLEGLSLHWASIQAVWHGEIEHRRSEALLQLAHITIYLTAVFTVLSPPVAVAFIAVHQGLWGVYMGCSFAPGHKGMPTYHGRAIPGFLHRQVLSSRNVRGGPWVDFALGGLNYQIEHHLFPGMPRANLRRAQPLVRDFCTAHGIDYAQCGLLRSYRYVLAHLHDVSAPLRVS